MPLTVLLDLCISILPISQRADVAQGERQLIINIEYCVLQLTHTALATRIILSLIRLLVPPAEY